MTKNHKEIQQEMDDEDLTREWIAVTVAGDVIVTRCDSRAEAIAQVLKKQATDIRHYNRLLRGSDD